MTNNSRFLKLVTIGMGIVVLLFMFLFNIQIFTSENVEAFPIEFMIAFIAIEIIFVLVLACIFFVYKIITKIIDQNFFTNLVLSYLKNIKSLVQGVFVLSVFTLPMFYWIAQTDDAPGLVLFGIGICFIPFVATVFLLVINELFEQMIQIKEENDYTV